MDKERKYIIQFVVLLIGIIYAFRLLNLQVFDETYAKKAEDNIIHREIEYPYRGLIFDRNNKLLVYNQPEYDLLIIPQQAKSTRVEEFCTLFSITKEEFEKKYLEAKKYSPVKPSIFIKQLSDIDFALVQDKLIDFPGFFVKARSTRAYKYSTLANALGYVSEITREKLATDTSGYYKQGDYVGQSGVELYYEQYLRGKRGVKYKVKNVKGEDKGSFKNGQYDTLAVSGQNLISTIDIDLQLYGDKLMEGKSGSIVAIEPSTGEIICFVSSPSYDPGILTGKNFGKNFERVAKDSLDPLFNRPLMAQYRPGSIFKVIQAMVGLSLKSISPDTRIQCNRSLIGCHGAHSFEDLTGAITHSCNPYFYNVMRRTVLKGVSDNNFEDSRIGLAIWKEKVESFGLGAPLGIDLPNEKSGLVPGVEYYDKAYRGRPWKFSNIYSIAIGEGENLVVPIQMANVASIIANRGYYITPHVIKSIGENGEPLEKYEEKHYTGIDPENFEIAVEAMKRVVESGTGRRAWIPGVEVCGKTGTVQNNTSPDHSVFIAFAPKENPKIAVSVYVEDAGQGGRAAASIASLIIEKYLYGSTRRPYIENYALKGDFLY
ncbi:MAG: penicillin-binding transpeptidase domain-containing protein [Cyclobacteriaceae bacterium]|nr:penicillin-binding transpeptidase domain-containing protein [Cyclobacteriaceae bacterium]